MEVLLAEKVKVGEPGPPGFETAWDPQPVSAVKMIIAGNKKLTKRSVRDFILSWPPGSGI
jgi:hypothetical protein